MSDPYKVLKPTEQMRFENGRHFPAVYTIFGDGIAFNELDENGDPNICIAMLYWEDLIPYIPKHLLNKAGSKVPQCLSYKKTSASIDRFQGEFVGNNVTVSKPEGSQ